MLFSNALPVSTVASLTGVQSEMSDKCLRNGVLFLSCRSMHLQCSMHSTNRDEISLALDQNIFGSSNFTSFFDNSRKDANET